MDEGAMLAPNASIVSVLDIDTLVAVIYVIERDYPKIQIGQTGTMTTDAYRGRTFPCKVVRVAPLLKETSREARVEMAVPNKEGLLKPGMFVRVEIELTRKDGATIVPISALTKRNGNQGVFLVDVAERKVHFSPVTLGIVNKEWAEVLDPPLSGDVVTLGHHLLEEGSTIILTDRKPGAKADGGGEEDPSGGKRGAKP